MLRRKSCSAGKLATAFLDLGAALADFKLRIAFANHINSATPSNDLTIGVAILEGTDTANDLHDNILEQVDWMAGRWIIQFWPRIIAKSGGQTTPNGSFLDRRPLTEHPIERRQQIVE